MKPRTYPHWIFLALIPLSLIIYSNMAMGIGTSGTGFLDHVAFILLFLVVQFLIARIKKKAVKKTFSLLMTVLTITFFLGNILYFRFFQTWAHVDIFLQWTEIPALQSSLASLITLTDVFAGILIPLAFWWMSQKNLFTIPTKPLVRIFLIVVLIFSAHYVLSSPSLMYEENNPFFLIVRQKIQQWGMRIGRQQRMKKIKSEVHNLKLLNKSMYAFSDSTTYPFEQIPIDTPPSSKKPNVVIIFLESVRAFESGAYGANPSFSPEFDRLAQDGTLLTQFYANGAQTTRAEFALLNSFIPNYLGGPIYQVNPRISVVSLPSILKRTGYKTLWISGFSSKFGQKHAFLSRHGIEEFHDTIPNARRHLGWGPSDEDIYDSAIKILREKQEPFFAHIMSLSNHFPFDAKMPTAAETPAVAGDGLYARYTQALFYTDYALGKFMRQARKEPWYSNTIFFISGDHGIWTFPSDSDFDSAQKQEIYFRVPGLIYSPLLKKSEKLDVLASHIDVAPTLLDMLNIRAKNSFLGSSILRNDTDPRFVFMVHDGRWNLRTETDYIYDSGPESFIDHFPYINPMESFSYADLTHTGFSLASDLFLNKAQNNRKPLSAGDLEAMEFVGDAALRSYMVTMTNDRISDPRDAFWDLEDGKKIIQGAPQFRFNDQPQFIAHAGGRINGLDYTNSLEALNASTAAGFRHIEVDISKTKDNHYVLVHDWGQTYRKIFNLTDSAEEPRIPTLKEFKSLTMTGGLTQMTFKDLLKWLEVHPEVNIVTDFKIPNNTEGLQNIREKYPQYMNQFIPQIYYLKELPFTQSMGYEKIILTLYRMKVRDYNILQFSKENKLFAITMPASRALNANLARELQSAGLFTYAHTINDPQEQAALKKRGINGFYVDALPPSPH